MSKPYTPTKTLTYTPASQQNTVDPALAKTMSARVAELVMSYGCYSNQVKLSQLDVDGPTQYEVLGVHYAEDKFSKDPTGLTACKVVLNQSSGEVYLLMARNIATQELKTGDVFKVFNTGNTTGNKFVDAQGQPYPILGVNIYCKETLEDDYSDF